MNPVIPSLHGLQLQDRRLTRFESRLAGIPDRLKEIDADIQKLESMLTAERNKLSETRTFQRQQEMQLQEEEEHIRQSKNRMNQASNNRELQATQREVEATRRMVQTRTQEIARLQEAVTAAEARIEATESSLKQLRVRAEEEKTRLVADQGTLATKIAALRKGRGKLTEKVDRDVLATYERIRVRLGGLAFVAAGDERCTACKMMIPHQLYVRLMRGEEILACEHCGRMLYWEGHFPEERDKRREATRVAPIIR